MKKAQDLKDKSGMTLIAMGIESGGLGARLFGYAMYYIPLVFIAIIIAALYEETHRFIPTGIKTIDTILFLMLVSTISIFPFIFWERSIRKFRRKHGLSVYGNIREELEQMEIDERVKKEHKAFVNNGLVKDGVDKNDVGYWFGLLEIGAISKEEYEAKKAELLK